MPPVAADFAGAFSLLKPILAKYAAHLTVKADTPLEYSLIAKPASEFRQRKGQTLDFGSVRLGKAYVRFHLMPLYMSAALSKSVSPALQKRMQGKTCFNFKHAPDPHLIAELERLAAEGFRDWAEKKWS